jgi:hypothetical protein
VYYIQNFGIKACEEVLGCTIDQIKNLQMKTKWIQLLEARSLLKVLKGTATYYVCTWIP